MIDERKTLKHAELMIMTVSVFKHRRRAECSKFAAQQPNRLDKTIKE